MKSQAEEALSNKVLEIDEKFKELTKLFDEAYSIARTYKLPFFDEAKPFYEYKRDKYDPNYLGRATLCPHYKFVEDCIECQLIDKAISLLSYTGWLESSIGCY